MNLYFMEFFISYRYIDKQEWNLLVTVSSPDESMDGPELGERLGSDLEGTITIPT